MVRFHLRNSFKPEYTHVYRKLCHATPHLFRSYIEGKMVKHFVDGSVFNAYIPHYSLERPKQYMSNDTCENILKGR